MKKLKTYDSGQVTALGESWVLDLPESPRETRESNYIANLKSQIQFSQQKCQGNPKTQANENKLLTGTRVQGFSICVGIKGKKRRKDLCLRYLRREKFENSEQEFTQKQ